jgi:autotransporter-associated beta strand protein
MNTSFTPLRFFIAAALLLLAAQRPSLAGSATWDQNPSSGDWNTAANWTPQTVPNSTTDIATFGASNVTNLSITNASVSLDSAVFNSGAPPYTLTIQIYNLLFYGAGIVNNSGSMQSIVAPTVNDNNAAFFFYNSATAGNMTSYSTVGGLLVFYDSSSAGSATFDLTSGSLQADIDFNDDSTAGNATINASASSVIEFFDSSTGGNSTLNLSTAAFVTFAGSNNAEHMTCTCIGGAGGFSSQMDFQGFSSAGEGTFTTIGGSTSGEQGAFILFDNTATADNATFIINGGMGAGLSGTALLFIDTTTAANANITANGGVDGSDGGVISFQTQSKGGKASITLNGNGELDISTHNAPGVTIGSLAGVGSVLLGANTLTIGNNNQSTAFSGVIQDSGGLTKSGTGTLTLTGANTYTGTTTVSAGTLQVSNNTGSGTGSGAVNVNVGTVGGKGIIAGAMTIGTGSGTGAFLAPAAGTNVQATLTIQSALTFNADATYNCTFRAKRNRVRTDKVVADGVTINSGAMIALSGQIQGALTQGLILTLISNTSANPISGTFSNLPDGGIVTINGNNFQASYEGGDGNDLTLTVVP